LKAFTPRSQKIMSHFSAPFMGLCCSHQIAEAQSLLKEANDYICACLPGVNAWARKKYLLHLQCPACASNAVSSCGSLIGTSERFCSCHANVASHNPPIAIGATT